MQGPEYGRCVCQGGSKKEQVNTGCTALYTELYVVLLKVPEIKLLLLPMKQMRVIGLGCESVVCGRENGLAPRSDQN